MVMLQYLVADEMEDPVDDVDVDENGEGLDGAHVLVLLIRVWVVGQAQYRQKEHCGESEEINLMTHETIVHSGSRSQPVTTTRPLTTMRMTAHGTVVNFKNVQSSMLYTRSPLLWPPLSAPASAVLLLTLSIRHFNSPN